MPLWEGTKQQGDASDVTAASYIALLSVSKKTVLFAVGVLLRTDL